MQTKNYAPATIEEREAFLRTFVQRCDARSETRPADVTKPILERYQRHFYNHRKANGRPMSFRSQHVHLVSVRAFLRWATRQNYLLYNPASEIELPRLERRLPRVVLSVREVEAVIAQPDVSDAMGVPRSRNLGDAVCDRHAT